MSVLKTLAERLQWIADNLHGFREEPEITRHFAKSCAPTACSEAKPGGAQRAAQKSTGYAYTPRVIRG